MTIDQSACESYACAGPEADDAETLLAQLPGLSADDRSDIEARVVQMHMPLARRLAGYFAGRGVAADDLEQVAYLGLLTSARRFDPALGRPFVPFASATIRGYIRRHFRDCGWAIRPPRALQELQRKVWSVRDDLTVSLGRPPTVRELASTVGADVKDVEQALRLHECFTMSHLDAPAHEPDSVSLADVIGMPDGSFERVEAVVAMRGAIRTLKDRDREILRLRFFEGLTQKEVGEQLGVTQMQVSRLLTRILRDLRRAMEAPVAA